MPHHLLVYYSHATQLLYFLPACHTTTWSYLEPQPRYLAGTFRAILGRNCNAGDTGDTGSGNAGVGDSGAPSSTSELCNT